VFFPCQRVGQVLGDEITEAQTFVQLADQNQATIGGDPRLAPLLPRMQIKPRTVSACHFVAAMISASVAPLARFIIAITSAFLLARSALGLLAGFLVRDFFAAVAFLAGARLAFGCGTSGADPFSD
jgi:hypothetical protein